MAISLAHHTSITVTHSTQYLTVSITERYPLGYLFLNHYFSFNVKYSSDLHIYIYVYICVCLYCMKANAILTRNFDQEQTNGNIKTLIVIELHFTH